MLRLCSPKGNMIKKKKKYRVFGDDEGMCIGYRYEELSCLEKSDVLDGGLSKKYIYVKTSRCQVTRREKASEIVWVMMMCVWDVCLFLAEQGYDRVLTSAIIRVPLPMALKYQKVSSTPNLSELLLF